MQVFKCDDSLAMRLPEPLVEEMGIAAGDEVNLMSVDNRTIAISKVDQDADFVRKLRALQKATPEGFVWNRDDANAR
jgi:antitoxin MazE